ncbi:hypothetical protein QQ045_012046 [Rhodiola kirilowii]
MTNRTSATNNNQQQLDEVHILSHHLRLLPQHLSLPNFWATSESLHPDWFSTPATAEDNPCLYNFMEEKNNDDEFRRRREHHHQSSLSYYSSDQSSHDSQTLAMERIQKEHMFDKVVTPSDVGKLNRLVIPKQHAERSLRRTVKIPLAIRLTSTTSSERISKGLLLNFEDSTRKLWRFRYSYWINSSQSYVMTKGWNRFVKEKKLEAGDIVSFQRGFGEASRDRLFIDWRRRPTSNKYPLLFHYEPGSIIPSLSLRYHYFPFNQTRPATWGTTSTATPPLYLRPLVQLTSGHHFPQHNYSYSNLHFHSKSHHYNQYKQQQQLQQCSPYTNNNNGVISDPYRAAGVGSSSQTVLYLRSSAGESPAGSNVEASMVFDSVPVVHPKAEGKKLRLFGVSMECENQPNTLAESETLSSSPNPGAASSPSESPTHHATVYVILTHGH